MCVFCRFTNFCMQAQRTELSSLTLFEVIFSIFCIMFTKINALFSGNDEQECFGHDNGSAAASDGVPNLLHSHDAIR